MLRFLADENFDNGIVRGLLRRQPDLDIIRLLTSIAITMIQNRYQYEVTNFKLNELERSLASIADNPNRLSERLFQAEKAGLQVWIDRLKAEIAEYEEGKG